MAIYISGSLAFDRIMSFPGNFQDHILMDRLHMINVSFMVDGMDERRGGCAGNIAYSMALLGEKPVIVSCAGKDFDSYGVKLAAMGLPLDGISLQMDIFTALCFITTDMNGNQITGFYPGAMSRQASFAYPELDPEKDLAIISPGNVEDMRRLPLFFKEKRIPYIYDPGQQLPVLSADDLRNSIEGAFALVTNDYELHMICNQTGLGEEELLGRALWLVTTLGGQGCRVRGADGTDERISAVEVTDVKDPTGAGDAQRAGLLKGLALGLPVPEAARIGAVTASFAIECLGTQEHKIDPAEFARRHVNTYGPMPEVLEKNLDALAK